jgi:acetyl/propionyl-CoA carboxylase alpha subunit
MATGSDRASSTAIEVQLLVDERGAAWTVGVVVHTIRGGRTVLSTTAQGTLDVAQLATCERVAVTAAGALALRGAVSIELSSSSHRDRPSIRRVRPHLTPAHTLSEVTTGLDLVARQFELAAGSCLSGGPPSRSRHAASAMLQVDELQPGSPATTSVEWLEIPFLPGLRCDAAVEQGDVIPAALGTELVTFTATGQDRGHALARLGRTMERCTVVPRAGATDRGRSLDALRDLGADPGPRSRSAAPSIFRSRTGATAVRSVARSRGPTASTSTDS